MSEETHTGSNLYALLIGINCYLPNERAGKPNKMNLGGCVRDINRVEEFLRTRLGLPEDRIVKLTSTDGGLGEPAEPADKWPTRENIVGAFKRLRELASPGDEIYVHYSGHGGRVRTPPRFQHIKGGEGFDEALVPADYNDKEDKFLRDFELGNILRGYVERGLVLTVVLDSCHSGGATRGEGGHGPHEKRGTAVRSIGVVSDVFPPPENPVASDEELAASLRARSPASARDFEAEGDWLIEPKGYVLLAACRPSEYAYEHTYEGTGQTGVLTYWLLDSLNRLGTAVTFKRLYERILAKVHGDFRNQTPQLQGEADRVVFGGERARTQSGVTVLRVDAAADEVVLNVGMAQGVSRGARFAIYPNGEADFTRLERRRALVSIETLGATDSRAAITERLSGEDVEQGDQAVLLEWGAPHICRTLRLVTEGGKVNGSRRAEALKEVELALRRREGDFVRMASDESPADFLVSVNEEDEYVISDSGGVVIPNLRPALRVGEWAAPGRVAEQLVHLTKYFNVRELENCDPFSPLRRQLPVELLGTQAEYAMGEKPAPRPFEGEAGVPTLKAGEWAFLKIQNNSSRVLNITVLDLRPNWAISQIYPAGAALYEPLDPGQSLTLPLRAGLPHGYERGRGVIKVLAAVGASNFRWLELPPLDDPGKGGKVWRSEPTNPLEKFLAAFMQDGPRSRDFFIEAAASHEWTTGQVEMDVRRA